MITTTIISSSSVMPCMVLRMIPLSCGTGRDGRRLLDAVLRPEGSHGHVLEARIEALDAHAADRIRRAFLAHAVLRIIGTREQEYGFRRDALLLEFFRTRVGVAHFAILRRRRVAVDDVHLVEPVDAAARVTGGQIGDL